jgi:hypothetical protein
VFRQNIEFFKLKNWKGFRHGSWRLKVVCYSCKVTYNQKRYNRSSQFCKKRTAERRSKCYLALFCRKAAMCSNFQRNLLSPVSLTCVPSFRGNLLRPLHLTCVPFLRGTCCLHCHLHVSQCCLHYHLLVSQVPWEPVVTIITCVPTFTGTCCLRHLHVAPVLWRGDKSVQLKVAVRPPFTNQGRNKV